MSQGFLFDPDKDILTDEARKLARRNDPETSHEAARRHVESGRLREAQARVLRSVSEHGGSTYAEISVYAGLELPEAARRLPELEGRGFVHAIGKRVCRIKGTECRLWYATGKGIAWVKDHPA